MSQGLFLITRDRGPAWDATRAPQAQELWAEHAAFMTGLVQDGVVVLGGAITHTSEALLVIKARTIEDAQRHLSLDPWTLSGHLIITRIQSWELQLGSLA